VTPQLVRWAIDTGLKVRIEGVEALPAPASLWAAPARW
jgi:hypothetical protein